MRSAWYSTDFSASALVANEGDADSMKRVVNASRFAETYASLHPVTFSSAPVNGNTDAVDFNCSPQVIYHKNFELISSDFHRLIA